MKKSDDDVFVPSDTDGDAAEEEAEETGPDVLLGNAFDAFQDGDRAGFIRSMKAAIGTAE
jgi:hypothetical protein